MPKFAANLTLTFTEHDFPDRFDAAASNGLFDAVEFMFPYDFPATMIKERADAAGLPIALFNAATGTTRGNACLPGRQAEFRAGLEQALSYASVLATPRIHVMAGIAQVTRETEATYVENLAWAARLADRQGVELLIEPINGYSMPDYFLHDLDHARRLIDRIGQPNVKLLFDVFHIQQIHGDLTHRLTELVAADLIGHIQIANVPDRHEPGAGEVNYDYLFDLLDALGYRGYLGCEYHPAADTVAGLDWLARQRQRLG